MRYKFKIFTPKIIFLIPSLFSSLSPFYLSSSIRAFQPLGLLHPLPCRPTFWYPLTLDSPIVISNPKPTSNSPVSKQTAHSTFLTLGQSHLRELLFACKARARLLPYSAILSCEQALIARTVAKKCHPHPCSHPWPRAISTTTTTIVFNHRKVHKKVPLRSCHHEFHHDNFACEFRGL